MEQTIWSVDAPLCAPCAVMLRRGPLYVGVPEPIDEARRCAWCEQAQAIAVYPLTDEVER